MKKNFIKKLLIGGLITSLCLCCCFLNFKKNVNASAINEFQEQNNWFEDSSFLPSEFTDINDLKGKTFSVSLYTILALQQIQFDFYINILERDYIGIEINEETHETIQCVDYLQYPYIIYDFFSYSSTNSSNAFNVFSFYKESSDNFPFLYMNDVALNRSTNIQFQGCLLSKTNNFSYLPIDNLIERNDVPLGFYSTLNQNNQIFYLNYSNKNFLIEEDFLNSIGNEGITTQYLDFYIVFPNTDRYSLSLNPSLLLSEIKYFKFIQPYNANIDDKLNYGKQQYQSGYNKGISDATDGEYRFYFLTGIFNAVTDVLAIEIFPNVQIGYFILVPLALGITGMIFYFWRKD